MAMTPGEVSTRLRQQAQQDAAEEAERGGHAPPINACVHPQGSLVRALLYKGPKPLNVSYCEECGALGPGGGIPTIGGWVNPKAFRP